MIRNSGLAVAAAALLVACSQPGPTTKVPQWVPHEISLFAANAYDNPYTDVDLWLTFVNDRNDSLVRPAFWYGGNEWRVRFAPPDRNQQWHWRSAGNVNDEGLINKQGRLRSVAYQGDNELVRHGLLRMSPGRRNVVHADGTPFLLVGDTPWSIPFRATTDQVHEYADDRQSKGYNAALLISMQPDKNAQGPESRNTVLGFDRAFADASEGHLTNMKADYFQTLDSIIDILIDHEIVPVYAPVAHGYGWKGETPFGPRLTAEEYSRYCKYLVARYGATPALWLVNLDGNARAASIKPAGETIHEWDSYDQPTGVHYSPQDDWLATWANGDSTCCFHYNRMYQDEEWLDFQWAQTGHDGLHLFHKVRRMYDEKPTKANMVGESTYEAMGDGKLGLGWWQGEDAWQQLMQGGTMGVVYGAACLWQWKITADEPAWESWTNAPFSWRDALQLEGSNYVGHISKAFEGLEFTDIERRFDLTEDSTAVLTKDSKLYISYLHNGGNIRIKGVRPGLPFRWFDPKQGLFQAPETTDDSGLFKAPGIQPWVLVIGEYKR